MKTPAEPRPPAPRRIRSKTLSLALALLAVAAALNLSAANLTEPSASRELVFEERNGLVAIEAEHYFEQTLSAKRAWHLTTQNRTPKIDPDGDPSHVAGASGGAYLELLPDTRRTHSDRLITGENFSNEPGKMAVLSYKVHFNTPGTYWLWARAFTTTSEDNGLHFGINGTWPATAQRWQTVTRDRWHWESKQRTDQEHTGVPGILTLHVPSAGVHTIQVSMREDGLELDKILLVNRKEYTPEGLGPEPIVKAGKLPATHPFVPAVAFVSADAPKPAAVAQPAGPALRQPRQPDGSGRVEIGGDLKQWHKVTLTLDGPFAHEQDNDPNPFTDHALTVTFAHESGSPRYAVPGYFAADGAAANTSAESGTKWRAHLSPDKPGQWTYAIRFVKGKHVAVSDTPGERLKPFDGVSGSFNVAPTDKKGRDFRAQGRLQYVGKHHLQFAGSQEYFLKAGPDSPENLLAYTDFDGTRANTRREGRSGEAAPGGKLKTWQPHVRDWQAGNPTWKEGRGKGLIGALNYIADKGCNSFSFLPYNAGGDGDDVWPFVEREDKFHYDCSKLDQWGIVFDHATARGLYLHFKLQENEIDDNRRGHLAEEGSVPESLDGGKLGPERRLYCRELIARFAHNLALNWNIGEENTQSTEEIRDMARYLRETDPYKHHIVIHTFPGQQEKVYRPLLGNQSELTGVSLQNSWNQAHQLTLKWVHESAKAGKPWVAANDEQNPAEMGVSPDPGYAGHDGTAIQGGKPYTMHDIRKFCLWGTLTAGGAGVEYYFGYKLPQNDLVCEDWRSREKSWDYCRIALDFFREHKLPFWEMQNADALIGNPKNDNSKYCLAKPGEVYLVFLPNGGATEIDLSAAAGEFTVKWFNPRAGGPLQDGPVQRVKAGGPAALGQAPADPGEDWLVLVRK